LLATTQYRYAPFGATATTGEASGNPAQFTGREADGTGLFSYRARYYDPTTQRFLSEDPLSFGGGDANLYRYVRDNPTNFTDPTGEFIDIIPDVGFIGYDFYKLFTGGRKDLGGNLAALGLDALAAAIPGVTGLGEAGRAALELRAQQRALRDLVSEAARKGRVALCLENANAILDWAKEYRYPGASALPGDVASPSNWRANPVPHIHLPGTGRSGHVPVVPGVPPRPFPLY
jgi:RHS repeat-associated protein